MLANLYGPSAPMRLLMERQIVSAVSMDVCAKYIQIECLSEPSDAWHATVKHTSRHPDGSR
jgi:hypothetical protein